MHGIDFDWKIKELYIYIYIRRYLSVRTKLIKIAEQYSYSQPLLRTN